MPEERVAVTRRGVAVRSVSLVVLLAATWVIVDVALDGAGAGTVSAGRTAFAAWGLFLLVQSTERPWRDSGRDAARPRAYPAWQLILLAGTGVTGYTVLSTVAIALAGPVLPSLVLSLSPAAVLLLDAAVDRRRIPLPLCGAVLVAVAGAVLFVIPRLGTGEASAVVPGLLAAVGAMLSMAVYSVFFARVNRGRSGSTARRILPIFVWGSLPLLVWAAGEMVNNGAPSMQTVLALAFLGLGVYVPAYLLQHRLLLDAGPTHTALLGLAVPAAVGAASALLGVAPAPAPLQILGMLLGAAGMLTALRLLSRLPLARLPLARLPLAPVAESTDFEAPER